MIPNLEIKKIELDMMAEQMNLLPGTIYRKISSRPHYKWTFRWLLEDRKQTIKNIRLLNNKIKIIKKKYSIKDTSPYLI